MPRLPLRAKHRLLALLGVFCTMSILGHWYEMLLELAQLPFGYALSYDRIWHQPLEPYLAYGFLSAAMVIVAMSLNFNAPTTPKTDIVLLRRAARLFIAGIVIVVLGQNPFIPFDIRLLPLPSALSTLVFGWVVYGLASKYEHKLYEIPTPTLANICCALFVLVCFLQVIFVTTWIPW